MHQHLPFSLWNAGRISQVVHYTIDIRYIVRHYYAILSIL